MIRNYFYSASLKKFVASFANIFAGLEVKTGQEADGSVVTVEVPIRVGSTDRVIAAIAASNTENRPHSLPMLSCYMTALDLAPERLHGVNQVDQRTFLRQGDVFPDDVKSIQRVMPIPYDMQLELALYASNTDQLYQILEQILILFDYDLQLQFNDAAFDWTKIAKLYLTGINNEENYPAGTERRMLIWTLNFRMPIWLSPPLDVRAGVIERIMIRIAREGELRLFEMDQTGELVPFLETVSTDDLVIEGGAPRDPTDPTGLGSR